MGGVLTKSKKGTVESRHTSPYYEYRNGKCMYGEKSHLNDAWLGEPVNKLKKKRIHKADLLKKIRMAELRAV